MGIGISKMRHSPSPEALVYLQDSYQTTTTQLGVLLGGDHPIDGAVQVLLTDDQSLFRDMYHDPENFDRLPPYVWAYINAQRGVYVIKDETRDGSKIMRNSTGSLAHEQSHLLLPPIVRAPRSWVKENVPYWMNEAISVSLFQRADIDWLRQELTKNPIRIEDIEERGFFDIDRRHPSENIAYQYAAIYAETLGMLIMNNELNIELSRKGLTTPFSNIIQFIKDMWLGKHTLTEINNREIQQVVNFTTYLRLGFTDKEYESIFAETTIK